MDTSDNELGLRERKNLETRQAIVRATVELTLQDGYAAATIPRIAKLANVSPRTVSTWFPAKDDIIFANTDEFIDRAVEHLEDGQGSTLDRLNNWFEDERGRVHRDPEMVALRYRAIEHDPELRARDRHHFEMMHRAVATSAARDMGVAEDAVAPQIFAGATMTMLQTLRARSEDSSEETEVQLALGLEFLQAGLEAVSEVPTGTRR